MKTKHYVHIVDPSTPENDWRGQIVLDQAGRHRLEISCSPHDKKTNLDDPIGLSMIEALRSNLDQGKKALLIGLERQEREIKLDDGGLSLRLKINVDAVAIGGSDFSLDMDSLVAGFSVSSPIIFSFLSPKAFHLKVAKRTKKVTISDAVHKRKVFSGVIFERIEIEINKSFGNSADGDKASINYSASAWLKPRKKFTLRQVLAVASFIERLMFLLVGNHCGATEVSIQGASRRKELCRIYPSSPFYANKDVVAGHNRVWTLAKVKIDLGKLLDRAMTYAKQIEKPAELLLEAQLSQDLQLRFFKRVRCLEAIGRDLLPRGSEAPPDELDEIEKILETKNPQLLAFFRKRCRPIFEKKNGLGYATEFAKKVFPFNPVLEIDKKTLIRLRNLEAHASAHNFTTGELSTMEFYSEILDFVARGLLLKYLGLDHDQILSGIPKSRFSWMIKRMTRNLN